MGASDRGRRSHGRGGQGIGELAWRVKKENLVTELAPERRFETHKRLNALQAPKADLPVQGRLRADSTGRPRSTDLERQRAHDVQDLALAVALSRARLNLLLQHLSFPEARL